MALDDLMREQPRVFTDSAPSVGAHRVELEFDGCGLSAKLICPESGCTPGAICGFCGHEYGGDEGEPCYVSAEELVAHIVTPKRKIAMTDSSVFSVQAVPACEIEIGDRVWTPTHGVREVESAERKNGALSFQKGVELLFTIRGERRNSWLDVATLVLRVVDAPQANPRDREADIATAAEALVRSYRNPQGGDQKALQRQHQQMREIGYALIEVADEREIQERGSCADA